MSNVFPAEIKNCKCRFFSNAEFVLFSTMRGDSSQNSNTNWFVRLPHSPDVRRLAAAGVDVCKYWNMHPPLRRACLFIILIDMFGEANFYIFPRAACIVLRFWHSLQISPRRTSTYSMFSLYLKLKENIFLFNLIILKVFAQLINFECDLACVNPWNFIFIQPRCSNFIEIGFS